MSRLFEALQRSEAERTGIESIVPAESVAELLQSAECETAHSIETKPDATDLFASATVLHPSPATDSRLICLTDQGGLGAEKFRVLGLRLRHMREKRKLRIVVTSTIPEEGKSVIAANLAINQARSKVLKTILIDGDLRRPTQAKYFGFSRGLPGLSECLRGERRLAEVVYRLDGAGLYFLPAGLAPENPIERMQSGRLADILEHLNGLFDWVVIDTPPMFPLADTPLWTKLADGVLLVTREGVSEKKMLARAAEAIDRSTLLGIVVNSCGASEHEYYYSRYSRDTVDFSATNPPQTEP